MVVLSSLAFSIAFWVLEIGVNFGRWLALPDSETWRTISLDWSVRHVDSTPKMELAWFIDHKQSKKVTSDEWFCISSTETCEDGKPVNLGRTFAPFDQPFRINLNLAVGGIN